MTVGLEDRAICAGGHAVQFYEHDAELANTVGRYLCGAVEGGAVAIVIATGAHRRAFEHELETSGIDPARARGDGTLVLLDAATTLASFMPDGRIDGESFHRVIGAVVREASETGGPVRAYGEMVALLWEAGDVLAAIELERLWSELGHEHQFSLLCAYRSQSVSGPEHAEALRQVCDLHTSVSHASTRDAPDQRAGQLSDLQVSGWFPAECSAPRGARRLVADALGRWGHGGSFLDDAQLVVSELATNAVVHAGSPFLVMARAEDSSVRVSVQDSSRVAPTSRNEASMALSGRGLHLIAALSVDWGVDVTAGGKTVWAELRP